MNLNAHDRIALTLGRLVMQTETQIDQLSAQARALADARTPEPSPEQPPRQAQGDAAAAELAQVLGR